MHDGNHRRLASVLLGLIISGCGMEAISATQGPARFGAQYAPPVEHERCLYDEWSGMYYCDVGGGGGGSREPQPTPLPTATPLPFDTKGVFTLAGSMEGAPGAADATGTSASFNSPEGITADQNGNVYVADTMNNRIRKITPNGTVTTIGGGGAGWADGMGGSAKFNQPYGLAVTPSGSTLYIADRSNFRIRRMDLATNSVTTLAGTGEFGTANGSGSQATFGRLGDMVVTESGDVYVTDSGQGGSVRKISASGTVSTLATGLSGIKGITADYYTNDVYAAIETTGEIKKISPTGSVSTVAWNLRKPSDVDVALDGRIFVTEHPDSGPRVVVANGGSASLLAGSSTGSTDGSLTSASFKGAASLTIYNGTLYVADKENQRIRKVVMADNTQPTYKRVMPTPTPIPTATMYPSPKPTPIPDCFYPDPYPTYDPYYGGGREPVMYCY